MTFLQGDIVIVPYPFSDLNGSKPRPAVIISNSMVNKTSDIILAAISSTIRNDDFSFTLEDNLVTRSLEKYCEIRCNKIFTFDKSLVTKKISSVKKASYQEVHNKIMEILQVK